MMAYSPEGQRPGSRKALSLGGSRERSGRGEFFAVPQDWSHLDKSRKRQCGQQKPTTLLNLNHILRGGTAKKLGASPSSRPLRRPSGAPPLPAAACLAAALPHILLPKFCYTTNSSPGLNLAAAGVGTRAVDCLRVETEGVSLRTDRKA